MRVFENKRFNRWARDERIAETTLCQAARDVVEERVEADLGGYLFKKRIAGKGGGKSGGYRTIVGYRRGNSNRVLFLYGFAKNERPNITDREHEALSIAAADLINATDAQVAGSNRHGPSIRTEVRNDMSKILETAHEMARDLHEVGAMSDVTMRRMDVLCLPPKRTFTADDIRRIRATSRMSQPVFAAYLNVGKTTVAQWEQGRKKPAGSAVRLLDLIDRKGIETIVA